MADDNEPYDDKPLTVRELISKLLEDDSLDIDSHVHVWMPGPPHHLNTGEVDTLVWQVAPARNGKGVWLHTVLNRDDRDDVIDKKLTSLHQEPPPGTIVMDDHGIRWSRAEAGYWLREGREDGDPESWNKVAGNYGPVRVVSHG